MQLEEIAQGKGSDTDFLKNIKQFVLQSVEEFKTHNIKIDRSKLGECPECGGNIIKGKVDYGCSNWRASDGGCKVVLRSNINGRWISPYMIKTLLEKKTIGPYEFPGQKPELAKIILENKDDSWQLIVKASRKTKKNKSKNSLGQCPACGGDIILSPKAFGCANWKESDGGCRFKIWKTIAKREIHLDEAKILIETGSTDILTGFHSKKGNTFDARLILKTNNANLPETAFKFQ